MRQKLKTKNKNKNPVKSIQRLELDRNRKTD